METNREVTPAPVNKQSVLSLVFGIIAIFFICLSWLPFPFTGIICFPISVFFGVLALIFGIISLNRIRKHNHSGRPMAWMGITIGGFVFLCMLCLLILIASLFFFAPEQFQPYLDKYHI